MAIGSGNITAMGSLPCRHGIHIGPLPSRLRREVGTFGALSRSSRDVDDQCQHARSLGQINETSVNRRYGAGSRLEEGVTMVVTNCLRGMVVVAFVGFVDASEPASAISADLAKKCRELALKAHPTPRVGTKTGAAKLQQDYFRSCVAKNGKVD